MPRAVIRAPRIMQRMLPCIAIAVGVLIESAAICHAQPAAPRRIPHSAPPALVPTERPVSAVLAQLESQLTALEASHSKPDDLAVLESEINLAQLRATGAAERLADSDSPADPSAACRLSGHGAGLLPDGRDPPHGIRAISHRFCHLRSPAGIPETPFA